MSFKTRNTLFLVVLVLLLSAIGSYVIFKRYPNKKAALQLQLTSLDSLANCVPERRAYLHALDSLLEVRRQRILDLTKVVDDEITMADVYDYLDQIQRRSGAVNFVMSTMRDVQASGYGYKLFSLKGEGVYWSIFGLVWFLEKGPRIYAIDHMSLHGIESVRQEGPEELMSVPEITVPFELEVRALYAGVPDLPPRELSLTSLSIPSGENLFLPLITRELPPNAFEALDVEQAELRVILPDRAVCADKSGKLHVLRKGDLVYLGCLTKIDIQHNCVEFTLNKGGIVEKFVLKLALGE